MEKINEGTINIETETCKEESKLIYEDENENSDGDKMSEHGEEKASCKKSQADKMLKEVIASECQANYHGRKCGWIQLEQRWDHKKHYQNHHPKLYEEGVTGGQEVEVKVY